MQLTRLSDVAPRPRRVAVGEFDGVHLGHREVIAGSDTVLTFEPHPLSVIRPAGHAQAAHQPGAQDRADRRAGGAGAGGDPVRRALCRPDPGPLHRPRAGGAAAGDARVGGRELPLRPPRRGRHGAAGRRRALRDPRGHAGRGRRGDRLLQPYPGAGVGRRRRARRPVSGRAVSAQRSGGGGGPARAHAGLSHRQHRPRRRVRVPRPRRLRGARRRRLRRGQRRGAAARSAPTWPCWSRPTCSTATSTSTAARCGSTSCSGCAASGGSPRSRRSWSRCSATSS